MASQKPKKLSEKALKNLAKSVGAFFLSKGTNDDLIFMGGFSIWDIRKCYCLCEQFHFIDAWEPRFLYFGEILQTICCKCSFLGSCLTVYKTAASKTITY